MTVHESERPGDKMHELSKAESDADGTNPLNGVGETVVGEAGVPVGDDVVGVPVGALVAPRFVGLGDVYTVGDCDGLVVGLGAATACNVKAGVICTNLSLFAEPAHNFTVVPGVIVLGNTRDKSVMS